ncbi:conserved hypothetical protein [Vibrio jasicida]|uniref:Uncharacterized protein n=1 Tax=Vibrio jasicida TaxID=766224 RepID=A0AAU9QTN0_9VIBR|nr:hypothetical protein [Vibrio coralliilyticus]PAW02369.1 hypothetical protein CKJ79_17045 [Vibrio coralliilyticus]CAH1589072.1 conserved hypothetical protein [Vibrio jasicida]CAH1599687.1 conserved hypothetical protein [Vibrio jasicida]
MSQIIFKDQIKLELCVLTNEELNVMGSSTVFVNHRFIPAVDLKKVRETYMELVNKAKDLNLKVLHRNGLKKRLDDLVGRSVHYSMARKDYEAKYALLRLGFQAKVDKGIFVGHSDDLELEGLTNLRNEMERLCLSRELLKQAIDIRDQITDKLLNINSATQLVL